MQSHDADIFPYSEHRYLFNLNVNEENEAVFMISSGREL